MAISATENTINETKEAIVQKQNRIQALERLQLNLRKKIAEHRKIILAYLANIYSQGNLILGDDGEVDLFQALILTEEDADFHLTDITYKTLVSEL